MTEKRLPWFRFHTADWRGDAGLRLVGAAARGLWIDMLTIMHEAIPYGHLIVGGHPLTIEGLAACACVTVQEAEGSVALLEKYGVFSRTENNVIYSRRMVADGAKANRDLTNGLAGGNPTIRRGTVPKAERVRRMRASDSPRKAERIFQRDNGCCHWCQVELSRTGSGPTRFQIDHVVAVCDGGTNEESNLVAACPGCNHDRAKIKPKVSDPNQRSDPKAKRPESRVQKKKSPVGLFSDDQAALPTMGALPTMNAPSKVEQAALEDAALRLWNAVAQSSGLIRCVSLSKARRGKMRERLADHGGLEGWQKALAAAEASDHWQGRTSGWRGSFDDFIDETKFAKLLEGSYVNFSKPDGKAKARPSRADPNADLYARYGLGRSPEPDPEGPILEMERT